MKDDLDHRLCEKYPKIFADRHAPMTETAMCWGFDHDDGWYNIIDQLCDNIQSHIDWQNKQGNTVSQVIATQVKEKFGTLRFYYEGGDDYINGMVRMAESISGITCEVCGNHGTTRYERWHRTLCDHHAKEAGYNTDLNNQTQENF